MIHLLLAQLILHTVGFAADSLVTGEFSWKSSTPLVAAAKRPEYPCDAIKDPTVVFHDGKWHLFCAIRNEKRTHQIEYLNFTNWKDADKAPRHILKLHEGYFCAPQVFYFTPLKKWCLLYQGATDAELAGKSRGGWGCWSCNPDTRCRGL